MSEKGKVLLTADDGSEEAFFVLEKAEIAGASYLLVADSLEDDAEAMILKEQSEGETLTYEVLEDEKELAIISKYMEELLEDIDLQIE